MAEREEDQDGADEPIVSRARKRFQAAIDEEDENRGKELDDMRFLAASPDDHYQWPNDIYQQRTKPGQEGGIRPCLTINKLPSHVRQITNELRMNRPQIVARPADSKASKEVAKALNGWLRHIQVASEADLAIDTAVDWQTGGGVGYFRMRNDYSDPMSFEQTVLFEPCPDRFKVYMDPIGLRLHPAGRRCKWGFIVEDLPREEYEAEYGEETVDWNLRAQGDLAPWFPSGTMVRVAEYFEIEERKKTICEWLVPSQTGGDPDVVTTVKGSPEDAAYTKAGYQKTRERETKIPRCIWRKMNGQRLLTKAKEMPTSCVPIVRVVGNYWIIEGKMIISGAVRNAKDAARMYNYNASKEIEVNALAPLAPITAMVDQVKGHEDRYRTANTVAFAYLPYNAVYNEDGSLANVSPPQRVQPPMPSMAIIQAKVGADNDIKATMGQWGPALGEPSGEKSGKAINARKVESDVGSFHYVDNVSRALRYAGTIALEMGAEIIDSKRVVRILGEDGEPDHIVVDPDSPEPYREEQGPDGKVVKIYNFALGKYEVTVNTGPSFTTKRAEAADFLTSAVQAARDPATANVLAYLAMKNQDWAGAEEAVTLLKALLPPQAQQALQQGNDGGGAQVPPELQPMINQLKQAVGQAHGQLDAAKQALAQRDQMVRELEQQVKSRSQESLAKVYDSDMTALAEITKARADLLIAQVNAAKAGVATGGMDVSALTQAVAKAVGELDAKIEGVAQHAAAIKGQLDNFEIAARMPAADGAAVPAGGESASMPDQQGVAA